MTSRNMTPFLPLADDGVWPEDVRRSASDIGHILLFGALSWPWLLRSLSGGSRHAKAALLARLDLAPDALPHLGSWKADTGFLTLIVAYILYRGGAAKMRDVDLAPERTHHSLQRTPAALRGDLHPEHKR